MNRTQRPPGESSPRRRTPGTLLSTGATWARLLAAIAVLIPAAQSPARAQVSPGPLARSHAHLEGAAHCLDCHARGASKMDPRCLACHREIHRQIERREGLHGRKLRGRCAKCHPDHAGRGFELIAWKGGTAERFDHSETGWRLQGKHAGTKCRACHRAPFQRSDMLKLLPRKEPEKSWLGLKRQCVSCHADVHRGTLDEKCESCHGLNGWRPASRFDHARTTYPLTGKHAKVACNKCHLIPGKIVLRGTDGKPKPLYRPIHHAECSDCHRDVHVGQLGPKCADCHVTDGWAVRGRKQFDHGKTKYPLRGKHASVKCAACHDPSKAWGKKPPFRSCNACHRDAHAGTDTLRGRATDCASCHDEKGFRTSTYTAADHDRSEYPLEGKHRAVRCDRCHVRLKGAGAEATAGTSRVVLRPPHAHCGDCHRDAHGGQLTARPGGIECASCHDLRGWKPSTYTTARHAKTSLPLEGRHAEVPCAACHGPDRKGLPPLADRTVLGSARIALFPLDARCESCHYDPHRGRFSAGGERASPDGCSGCHDARSFRLSTVDAARHDRFRYRLEGGHRAAPCVACHRELERPAPVVRLLAVEGTPRPLVFREKYRECTSCHRSPHGGQFANRRGGDACDRCHSVRAFRPADRFDHDRDSRFPLGGGHRGVACDRCHPSRPGRDGRPEVVYRPVETACAACHAKGVPARSHGEGEPAT